LKLFISLNVDLIKIDHVYKLMAIYRNNDEGR